MTSVRIDHLIVISYPVDLGTKWLLLGTKWPKSGYEMTKVGTKWPGFEMTWVRNDWQPKYVHTVIPKYGHFIRCILFPTSVIRKVNLQHPHPTRNVIVPCQEIESYRYIMLKKCHHIRKGIKPGTNARNPEPKSGTKFCQQNIAIKHACIELKFGSNVDYRIFFEMHISIFLHLLYFYYMQVKYRTMSWNTDPRPTFSVLTMSRNS